MSTSHISNSIFPKETESFFVPYDQKSLIKKDEYKNMLLKKLGINGALKTMVVTIVLFEDPKIRTVQEKTTLSELLLALSSLSYITPLVLSAFDEVTHVPQVLYSTQDGWKECEQLILGSDVFLFAEKEAMCSRILLSAIVSSGGVVVVPESHGCRTLCETYDQAQEQGYTFVAEKNTVWDLFAETIKIYGVFSFPYDWNTIRKNAMHASSHFLS